MLLLRPLQSTTRSAESALPSFNTTPASHIIQVSAFTPEPFAFPCGWQHQDCPKGQPSCWVQVTTGAIPALHNEAYNAQITCDHAPSQDERGDGCAVLGSDVGVLLQDEPARGELEQRAGRAHRVQGGGPLRLEGLNELAIIKLHMHRVACWLSGMHGYRTVTVTV
jgi:hypothetical protein